MLHTYLYIYIHNKLSVHGVLFITSLEERGAAAVPILRIFHGFPARSRLRRFSSGREQQIPLMFFSGLDNVASATADAAILYYILATSHIIGRLAPQLRFDEHRRRVLLCEKLYKICAPFENIYYYGSVFNHCEFGQCVTAAPFIFITVFA